jgi:TolB protein
MAVFALALSLSAGAASETADAVARAGDTPRGQLIFERATDRAVGGGAEVMAMAPDGSSLRRLARHGFQPAASPDGREIAYVRRRETPSGTVIWVMDASGRNQKRLTAGRYDTSPAWSANGKALFFARYRAVGDGEAAIFTMRRDGTRLRRMTAWTSACMSGLDVSPDGNVLAFGSASCDRPLGGAIEAIDMRGKPVPILQSLTPPPNSPLDWPFDPAWSPDGTRLAFSRIEALGAGAAYVADIDGSNARRLSPHALSASSPTWSPDGEWIALVRDRVLDWGYPGDIWIVRSNGTGLRRLTNTNAIDERGVTWLSAQAR